MGLDLDSSWKGLERRKYLLERNNSANTRVLAELFLSNKYLRLRTNHGNQPN